jgi:hypothetical protein
MGNRKLYRKRPKYFITAVQLDLEFDGLEYQKWGGKQKAKQGDWLVNNSGDTYTIDKKYFSENYEKVSTGVYEKFAEVWAEVATEKGSLKTLEGSTSYIEGDYLIYDREEGGKGYATSKAKFERMYEEVSHDLNLTQEQQSFINNRIQPLIEDFKAKAKKNKNHYFSWQVVAIVSAAFVPVISIFDEVNWVVATLGAISAIVAGMLSLFKFQENWIRCRNTYQELESHLSQFKVFAGIYRDRKQAFNLLAENCENILKAEIGQWSESHQKKQDDE